MKIIPLEKQKEIARNWREMKQKYDTALGLFGQMAGHPDVSDAMLLENAKLIGRAYNHVRDTQKELIALDSKQMFRY